MSLKTILKNFLNHVDTLEVQRKIGNDLYETDFQKLKSLTEQLKHDKDYATKEGLKDVNRRKNRYKDILPYDYTRVILSDYPGVPGSDYINANYIKGASGSLAYIASQGPLPNTVVDFWRMIWECEVQVIVMACNEQESGKYKCECYWPDENEKKQYGNINVEMVKWRQVCPDFLVRTLKACHEDEERVLCQFHYTTWPDHGVPNSVQPILELVRLIRDCQASEAVPVLVHCSAGCGRTGTICAIDYVWGLMRMGKLTKHFNLFNVISDMRKQRIAMVQTKEQYVLVHKAVSSLFEQQLRVIDSHTYENLNEDGEPLILPEESVYEDILEPIAAENKYQNNDNSFENDNHSVIPEYNTTAMDSEHYLSKLDNDKSLEKNNVGIVDKSLVTAFDCHVSAVAEQILNESDKSSARNSTTLLKLRREESVKHLISGWNKVSQSLEAPKVVAKMEQQNKSTPDEGQQKNTKHKDSVKKYVLGLCNRDSENFTEVCDKMDVNPTNLVESSCKKSSSDESSQHSGKLVGKATVIRRPSIAKLKALFEKSPAPDYEPLSDDSSRKRRPLFRSHSHYVGHSRNFSVHDHCQSSTIASYSCDYSRNSTPLQTQSSTNSSAVPYDSTMSRRAPSPDKIMYKRYDDIPALQNDLFIKKDSSVEQIIELENSPRNSHVNSNLYQQSHSSSNEKILSKMEPSSKKSHIKTKHNLSTQENKPNLHSKKQINVQEFNQAVHNSLPFEASASNDKIKLIASKSDDFLTTPKTLFYSDESSDEIKHCNETPTDNKLNTKKLFTSNLTETPIDLPKKINNDISVVTANKHSNILFSENLSKSNADKCKTHNNSAFKTGKYNTLAPGNLIGEKLKKMSKTPVHEPKIHQSYFDDQSGFCPIFYSTHEAVKLQAPMETRELKSSERIKNISVSKNETLQYATHQNLGKSKKSNNLNDDINAKNLLLHSPPPKCKRNHTSKSHSNTFPNQVQSELSEKLSDCAKKEICDALNSESSSSSKSTDLKDHSSHFTPINATNPVNRSDPRYFPVKRQTAEDARFASEQQKALEAKRTSQKYDAHSTLFSYESSNKPHLKTTITKDNVEPIKNPHSFTKVTSVSGNSEDIYSVHRPVLPHPLPPKKETKMPQPPFNGTGYSQSNVPTSSSFPHGAYPPGPPKPPRTFCHKSSTNENFMPLEKSKTNLDQEGGRYIVSVASPKQTDTKELDSRHNPPRQHNQPMNYSQNDSVTHPYHFSEYSAVPEKLHENPNSEAAILRRYRDSDTDRRYPPLREKKSEPLYGVIKNRHSDYENLYDFPRTYISDSAPLRQDSYHYATDMSHTLQYSQSDAGLCAVLQNTSTSQSHENTDDNGDVPKRVYFDTLQRRHKQQVSWEQRRSHDDMDIRPSPSARLKEQIHARRSLVELDNLEISVVSDNGFYEPIVPQSTSHRKSFHQDISNKSLHKKPPIEFTDSLLSKDIRSFKTHVPNKESMGFSGTLCKAFGKLTSLTKFNREPINRNAQDDSRTKVTSSGANITVVKEEKKSNFPPWPSRKIDPPEPSEQWTEV